MGIGNAPAGFLDRWDAIHSARFPIMTNRFVSFLLLSGYFLLALVGFRVDGRSILLSGHFLFFLYAFHAAISIRYWFAIDIAIRYRYRSSIRPRLFSIASSDIDSDSERTTITRCGQAALCPLWLKNLYFSFRVFPCLSWIKWRGHFSPPPSGEYARSTDS